MVYFLGGCHLPRLPAFLAQWMGSYVAVTNPFPCPPIPFLAGRVTLMLIVMRRNNLLVLLAVPPVCQLRAAGIGTGTLWFIWHNQFYLLPGRKKAPAVQSLQRLTYILAFVAIVILPDFQGVFLCLLVSS